jgi:hypothetical protein
MKIVHKYKKGTKEIFICYCNTVKCSAELTAKKKKYINEVKQIYM